MLDKINREKQLHIVTIEDPIEFLHTHKKCLVNQRELHADTHSFPNALKSVLREDPDVVLVGEMRDLETIESALRIAETGHLTLATLHTNSAVSSINRIIDVFPAHQQTQIRTQLSFVLEGIMCQSLLERSSGKGRAMAMEILVPNAAIRNLIREDKVHQIYSMMQTGQSKFGMQTFNQSLATLYHKKLITLENGAVALVEPGRAAGHHQPRRRRERATGPITPAARRRGGAESRNVGRLIAPCPTTPGRGATAPGSSRKACSSPTTKDVALATLRRQNIVVTGIRERGKEISLTKMGAQGPAQDPRGLHAAVLGHDRRGPPARAVPRDPGEPAGAQELPEDPPAGAAGRRGGLDARRRDAPAPEGLRQPLRQHDRRRRGGRYSRHDPPAPLGLHREGRQAARRRCARR